MRTLDDITSIRSISWKDELINRVNSRASTLLGEAYNEHGLEEGFDIAIEPGVCPLDYVTAGILEKCGLFERVYPKLPVSPFRFLVYYKITPSGKKGVVGEID